jgi:hypothetical protein
MSRQHSTLATLLGIHTAKNMRTNGRQQTGAEILSPSRNPQIGVAPLIATGSNAQNSSVPSIIASLPDSVFNSLTVTNNNPVAITFSIMVNRGSYAIPYANTLPGVSQPGNSVTVPISGVGFYVFASTAPITIKPNIGGDATYVQGTGVEWDKEGVAHFVDHRVVPVNPQTVAIANSPGFPTILSGGVNLVVIPQIGVGQPLIFPGTFPGLGPRKQIIITDMSGAGTSIIVLDKLGNPLVPCNAGLGAITFETSDSIGIIASAANVNGMIGEIFYATS